MRHQESTSHLFTIQQQRVKERGVRERDRKLDKKTRKKNIKKKKKKVIKLSFSFK